jgi:hypothetical protein
MQFLSRISMFANTPPGYYVDIPREHEPIYQSAPVFFLVLAIVTGGLWLARGRSFKTSRARALFLLATGNLLCSYTAWWVWSHRNDGPFWGDIPSVVAYRMPVLWVLFAIVATFVMRRSTRTPKEITTTPSTSSASHNPTPQTDPNHSPP